MRVDTGGAERLPDVGEQHLVKELVSGVQNTHHNVEGDFDTMAVCQ